MKKKLPLIFIAGLLLFAWFGSNHGEGTLGRDTIGDETSESSALVALSENSSSLESATVNDQAITVKNPTFQEVRDFVLEDPTSRNEFVLNQYECRHFATEVNNNAEAAGLRCAIVLLCYARGQHAVVAFDTTDRGIIYIEPQTDAAIEPEVGGKYQGQEIKEIRRDENRNMARFMKRVAKYGSKSAFTSKKEVPTSPKEIG
jgi:hypothetical protein